MNGRKLFSYLKKAFLMGSIKTIIVTLSTIILLPLIIQKIGIDKYGLISLVMIFGGVSVFADFGISKSVTILIGKKDSDASSIISNALVINALILSLIACVFIFVVVNDYPVLGKKLDITHEIKNYIVFMGFSYLVFMLLNNLLVAILEAFFLVHYVSVGYMISSISINFILYTVSILSDSLYWLLAAPVCSIFIVSLCFIFIVKVHTDVRLVLPRLQIMRGMLTLSYKFMRLGVINSLVIPANKYLIVYITGSSALLGVFDVGLKIAMIANSFLNSITQPLLAIFSSSDHDKSQTYSVALKISLLLLVFYILGLISFSFTGELIVKFIAPENYIQLYEVSFIFLIGVVFSSVAEPFYKALLGTERLKEALWLKLLVPVVNVITYCFLKNHTHSFSIAYSFSMFFSSLLIIIYYIYTQKANSER